MRNKITAFLLTLSLGFSSGMFASDNGDGTFTNPVVWGDFPEPDVIRVDDTYYMISTSMFYCPGFTILQSKDLINWEIACNALSEYKEDKRYDLEGSYNGYARGQWATSLQYFKGKFHMLFKIGSASCRQRVSPPV